MNSLQSVKGMHDVLPEEMPKWHALEGAFRRVVELCGYREIRTPVLEPLELFVRGIGEATDIVEKEMYAFEDKGGDRLALRPEGTASAIRAYVQHALHAHETVSKLYYIGPMFRRERPAKGRYRQFYQAGAELIGAAEPIADAEIIDMAVRFLEEIGVTDVCVQLSSLGDKDSRLEYRKALVAFLEGRAERLCGDCARRMSTNPLRVLDCKVEGCKAAVEGAPSVLDYLSGDAAAHFQEVRRLLDAFGTRYEVAPRMVRGLDYYTRTIFEIKDTSGLLGAQDTLGAGGRYDNLVQELGGRPTPAIGFGLGCERLLIAAGGHTIAAHAPSAMVIAIAKADENDVQAEALSIARTLRDAGIITHIDTRFGKADRQFRQAEKHGARAGIVLGSAEVAAGTVNLKDLFAKTQRTITRAQLVDEVRTLLNAPTPGGP